MDQVKEYLAVAMKHGFWIGSGIILIGALAIWFLSTSSLTTETDEQIRRIEADVSSVSQVEMDLPTQPNDISHQLMNGMIDVRKDEVLDAWQTVFDSQRKLLTWPEKLKDEFIDEFKYAKRDSSGKTTADSGFDRNTLVVDRNTLKLPFEKYEGFPPTEDADSVNPALLRRYEQYIGEVLPSYAEIAGCEWTADFEKRGGAMGGGGYDDMMGGMEEDYGMDGGMSRRANVSITGAIEEPVVKWSTSSQEAVLKDLFPWRGVKEYPLELDVYYSQENLWILRQLLQIVAAVNGDAKQSFEAEIREIKKLAIGRSVKFNQGSISDPGSRVQAGFGGMGGMDYDEMEMDGMDDYGMDGDMGGGYSGVDEVGEDPGDGRYVNTALEPIDAATLRTAFSSEDPNQVAIAVAKRLPVMLHLQMDQRSVAKLLAACGSAPLMVDVHQVRIMPKGGSASGGGMGGYDDMMGGMDEEMMMGGGMGSGYDEMGSGMGGAGAGGPPEDFPLDMEVEIYGLIYFFNPPSEESLGIEKVTDDTSIDESAETIDALPGPTTPDTAPAAPATTPAAPATTPAAPATTPAAPATTPAAPGTTPAVPDATPADPAAAPAAPVTTPPAPAGTPTAAAGGPPAAAAAP